MKAIFRIYKYDPTKDMKPKYCNYEIKIDEGMTLADALKKISAKADPIAYRKGCGSGVCGICAVRVNGVSRLICKTQINSILQATNGKNIITIDPLKHMNVVKDLVVDMDEFMKQFEKAIPWLENASEESVMLPEDVDKLEKAHECIYCGSCVADCSVTGKEKNFLGPAAFVKGYRFIVDPRDKLMKKRLSIYVDNGLWNCAHAYECVDACPKNIDPSEKIAKLREFAIEQGIGGRGARHAKHFVSSIASSGKLNEVGMTFKTLMPWGMHEFIGDAARMISKGRIPAIFPKKIKNHNQVKKLVKIAKGK